MVVKDHLHSSSDVQEVLSSTATLTITYKIFIHLGEELVLVSIYMWLSPTKCLILWTRNCYSFEFFGG
jgi:hypothetical protein